MRLIQANKAAAAAAVLARPKPGELASRNLLIHRAALFC
jgi:hypothetical protein